MLPLATTRAGYSLAPYIGLAGVLGGGSAAFLALGPPAIPAAFALLGTAFGQAMPDVMVDAAVAIRCNSHPALASDLQSLCCA